jgi:formylglycine-generating enzyme required for sulfatase activity
MAPFSKEQAEKSRAEWAKYEEVPERKQLDLGKGVKLDLVLIPPGQFRMGTEGNNTNEVAHDVTITKPFYMAVTETTQKQFETVCGKNPSEFSPAGKQKEKLGDFKDTSKFPVDSVNWIEAEAFAKRIGGQLPTEAQWEYACRAGTTTPFHFGERLNGTSANCDGTKPYATDGKGRNLQRTTTVGSYKLNAFGLFDMHGNVWEWCQDWYAKKTDDLEEKDPLRTMKQSDDLRVRRSGSWVSWAGGCRCAVRHGFASGSRDNSVGFRVTMPVR